MTARRWIADVARCWLMPWRAARRIRKQDETIKACVKIIVNFAEHILGVEDPDAPGPRHLHPVD